jgi:hypothetical protein
MKTSFFVGILVFGLFVGISVAQDEAPLVMPGSETPAAHSSHDDGECFIFGRYVVKTATSDDGGANVAVYEAGSGDKGGACRTAGDRVLYVEDSDNNAFYGISGKYMFIDKGTSAGSRDLDIYDLSSGTLASSISYNGDLQLVDRHFILYDAPSDKKGLLRDCKEAAKWKRQGGGVGWVQQKRFNLDTQTSVNVGTLRCVYVE